MRSSTCLLLGTLLLATLAWGTYRVQQDVSRRNWITLAATRSAELAPGLRTATHGIRASASHVLWATHRWELVLSVRPRDPRLQEQDETSVRPHEGLSYTDEAGQTLAPVLRQHAPSPEHCTAVATAPRGQAARHRFGVRTPRGFVTF
jgi:hypothetical protein